MDNKRLAVFFALSAAILIGWSLLFPPPKAPQRPPAPAGAPTAAATGTSAGAAFPASTAATAPATTAPKATLEPTPAVEAEPPASATTPIVAAEERVVTVTTDLYEARVSNRGGDLVSWRLRRYRDASGNPLELVRHGAPFPGRTLTLDPGDPFLARAAAALHQVESRTEGKTAVVRFRYREATGEELVRTWVFGPGYTPTVKLERTGRKNAPVSLVLGPSIGNPTEEDLKSQQYTRPGSLLALVASGSIERKPKDALKEPLDLGRALTTAGLEDNYFLCAFLPGPAGAVTVRPEKLEEKGPDGKVAAQTELLVVLSGAGSLDTQLFFGPKHLEILQGLRPGMEKLIDYGWFAVLVRPLLWGLRALHGVVGNWGVAIILITVLIKILLYPLTHQQLVSMKKMSKVQPKLEAIKAKYAAKIKQDPQARMKMNEEVMGVYKTEGINPASGCLPLLLQMPILIAFYRMLQHSIELRQAPFMLWITDLSAKDPYYITPILMTVTMWFQQQTMPATGDPAQRRIMAMMPLVFGFLFKDAPAGLVLYWLVQNVLTIVQQAILNRYTDLGSSSLKPAKPA